MSRRSGAGLRKARRADERISPTLEADRGMWKIRSLTAARQVLRARSSTTQAGFTAEKIPRGLFRSHPILISDGPAHDRQRREVARFFAPTVIADRYGDRIAEAAQRIVDEAVVTGRCRLDEAALHFTVDVTSQVVGLTESDTDGMAARLVAFFRQPPVDLAAENWEGRIANGCRQRSTASFRSSASSPTTSSPPSAPTGVDTAEMSSPPPRFRAQHRRHPRRVPHLRHRRDGHDPRVHRHGLLASARR
jgi:cytochrome P450